MSVVVSRYCSQSNRTNSLLVSQINNYIYTYQNKMVAVKPVVAETLILSHCKCNNLSNIFSNHLPTNRRGKCGLAHTYYYKIKTVPFRKILLQSKSHVEKSYVS